eukprot:TRINITY_DN13648_c0_g1_i3.p1 TRINITY_DN13648_c0_g1~~TRINITY_DN13648_c0_g1_i3.p1  ORF type:complete len:389 (+),score=27.45 TRINITY_DN13648_c0_g1_i3:252-1418(+)
MPIFPTADQLEQALNTGAGLFLARVLTTLKLCCLTDMPLFLHLRSARVFVSASGGESFLLQFIESGGILAALDVFRGSMRPDAERGEALAVLHAISSAGRSYKEIVCKHSALSIIAGHLCSPNPSSPHAPSPVSPTTASPSLAYECFHLLHYLAKGNPSFIHEVQHTLLHILVSCPHDMSVQRGSVRTLRALIRSVTPQNATEELQDSFVTELLDGVVLSLHTSDLKTQYPHNDRFPIILSFLTVVRYEIGELLKDACTLELLLDRVVDTLLACLRRNATIPHKGSVSLTSAVVFCIGHISFSSWLDVVFPSTRSNPSSDNHPNPVIMEGNPKWHYTTTDPDASGCNAVARKFISKGVIPCLAMMEDVLHKPEVVWCLDSFKRMAGGE